ncbi:MAG: hypothetical protein AAF438_07365, partial [Pseudomonadota bacterium]
MSIIRFVCLLAFGLYAGLCSAEVSLEAYGKLPQVSGMVISPNGERIAYRNTESDDDDYVVIYSLRDKEIVNLFRVSEIDPQYLRFSGNDHLLLVATRHIDSRYYRTSFDAGTTYAYDIEKNKVRPLVKLGESVGRGRSVYQGQSIGNIVATSDGGREIFIGAYVSESDEDSSPRYSLLSVKANSKGSPRVAVAGNDKVTNYFLDSDQNPVARVERNQRNNTHTVRGYDNGKWTKLYQYESAITTHSFLGLTSDYQSVVFLRDDESELQYYTLSLTDGKIETLTNWEVENSIARML